VVRYPRLIQPGSVCEDMILNVDFAQTFLDLAGLPEPTFMQGRSFQPLLAGQTPADWRTAMYYRYWMHGAHHNVYAHYGLRTLTHKLIYYYSDPLDHVDPQDWCCQGDPASQFETHPPEWELFDLQQDGAELRNVYDDPAYADLRRELRTEMRRQQLEVGDLPYPAELADPIG
jgi:arylsulfatase A-like enzyme